MDRWLTIVGVVGSIARFLNARSVLKSDLTRRAVAASGIARVRPALYACSRFWACSILPVTTVTGIASYDREAFAYVERGRARGFLDLLAESRAADRLCHGTAHGDENMQHLLTRDITRIGVTLRNGTRRLELYGPCVSQPAQSRSSAHATKCEFGRTPMVEIRRPGEPGNEGRDHHPLAFSMWMAGGGIKGGQTVGKTDDLGFNIVGDKVHVHDLQATILDRLGFDHTKLTYRRQGRDFRLTDVGGQVVRKLLA